MRRFVTALACAACFSGSAAVSAQQIGPGDAGAILESHSDRREAANDLKDLHFVGGVELEFRGGTRIYADDVWFYTDRHRAVATGNVVIRQGTSQISADQADFDTSTRLGTFTNATGFSTVQQPRQAPRAGIVAPPPVPGQETVVYFFGETVEKIGPKKYKIKNGGFTTCVQPTPRWDLHADEVVLNLDHYTLLRQAVMTVKGVPMFYLPILYYPTHKEDRATGILLPSYGVSTLRGQSFHNAFFWAIDRSQDATFFHDWYSKAGNGAGTEYRYNFGGGSDGIIRAYLLDQHETPYTLADGSPASLAPTRSYEVRGGANQMLPGRVRARASVDYFSSITSMQTFNTNVADASRSQRRFGGNVVGAWHTYSLNGTLDHNEYFYNQVSSNVTGSLPRISIARNERPLLQNTPFYVAFGTEYASILSTSRTGPIEVDQSLSRFDLAPQIRFPFKRWQWFTVNTSASWRETYYTRSLDDDGRPIDEGLNRQFVMFQAQMTGPVLNRIWDTPENKYAEKFKHTIEPYLNTQRTSSIDNFDHIIKIDGIDATVGGAEQYTYGAANRVYAKRRVAPGQVAVAREILNVDLQQTYYTNDKAAQYDRQYATSFSGAPPSHFSPILLNVRAAPANDINATVRAEFDSRYKTLRTISVSGGYAWTNQVQTSVGWSKRAFIAELPGFNDPSHLDHYLNGSGTVRTRDNQYGATYSFNYDVLNGSMTQQRLTGFYNAQCCGVAFEYQRYNFYRGVGPVPADRRFFMSFTLAGLGNFSPFNGALGGVPR